MRVARASVSMRRLERRRAGSRNARAVDHVAAVVVGIAWEPLGDSGLDKGVANLGVLAQRGDIERAAASPRVPAARFVMLGFYEVWQYRIVRPATVAELRPGVVVERVAADVHHAVDRARAAEGLAARDRDRAAVEVRFGLCSEPPIVAGVVEEFREADGDVNPHRIVK